ncbi:hypothetical protein BH10PSE1_BH10PSE1_11440 [soil metagenome]
MKTPSFIVAGLAVFALSACGSPDAQAPAAGGTAMSSLEPIDAVPLPLDDNPLSPPPVVEPEKKSDKAEDPAKADDATATATEAAAATGAETDVKPPRIVVAPRAPLAVASPKPASTPAPTPAPRVAPAEPERPVLNF